MVWRSELNKYKWFNVSVTSGKKAYKLKVLNNMTKFITK